jgi:hypothetical protein
VRLLEAGDRAALDVVTADWLAHDFAELPFEQPAHDDACLRQMHVLMRHGGAETWRRITDRMQHESVRHRLAKVLIDEPWQLPADADERAAVEAPAREALAALLADDYWFGTEVGVRHRGGFARVAEPTRADIAAFVLARVWPDEFRYDPLANAKERHAQLAALRTRLASDQGR